MKQTPGRIANLFTRGEGRRKKEGGVREKGRGKREEDRQGEKLRE